MAGSMPDTAHDLHRGLAETILVAARREISASGRALDRLRPTRLRSSQLDRMCCTTSAVVQTAWARKL
jgi:hypothetical protein